MFHFNGPLCAPSISNMSANCSPPPRQRETPRAYNLALL